MNCQSCGASLSAGARFCHKCGASTSPPPAPSTAAGWQVGLPWGIAGLALGALITVLVVRGSKGQAAAPPAVNAPFAGGGMVPAPDISQMSPEERAQRLFDRVMRLQEQGKLDSVQFFLPMAVGAYQQLPAMSLSSHFDVGLLNLAEGNAAGALAEADTIRKQVPTHLFTFVLRARAAQASNDAAALRQAYQGFLKNESAERGRGRPEYEDRRTLLDAFHTEATNGGARAGG
jgi:zinc-ribbon domain